MLLSDKTFHISTDVPTPPRPARRFGIFGVVLTPTRELAIQIGEQFSALGAPIGNS